MCVCVCVVVCSVSLHVYGGCSVGVYGCGGLFSQHVYGGCSVASMQKKNSVCGESVKPSLIAQ